MTGIDTGKYRQLLEAERARLHGAVRFLEQENAGSIEEELGEISGRGDDNHLADMATATYDRELDEGLEEGAQNTLDEIEAALERVGDGSYGVCEVCGEPIGGGTPLRDPVGASLHRRPAKARLSGVGSTEPHRSEGAGFAGAGSGHSAGGSTEPSGVTAEGARRVRSGSDRRRTGWRPSRLRSGRWARAPGSGQALLRSRLRP